jgi:hypothetical protein
VSLRFKTNLLEHAKSVADWARANDARAFVDLDGLKLGVRRGSRVIEFAAQYVGHHPDGSLGYFSDVSPACIGFVGWLPYPVQRWDLSTSKLAFKDAMRGAGVRVPAGWTDLRAVDDAFIVKRDRSAFGYGIRGPFAAAMARDAGFYLRDGEFAEAFKTSRIARAWYWAGTPAVLEVFAMPCVLGNGESSVDALLRQRLAADVDLPAGTDELARWQGLDLRRVPAAGRSLIADFRYVSPFNPTLYANSNRWAELCSTSIGDAFADAGRRVWTLIPGAPAQPKAFVLDAIVDDADRVWFLEVNSNAQLHPDLYGPMLDGLLGKEASGTGAD